MTGFLPRKEPPVGLSIRQPAKGYRFSIDAFLLADFASAFRGERVLDLGTGSGVVLLLLSHVSPSLRCGVGVEIQPALHDFAQRNFRENGMEGRLEAVLGDFRGRPPCMAGEPFDLVVSNPPYRRLGEGRRNPDPQKEIARHEVTCSMPGLFRAAGGCLSPKGRFALLGLPNRLPEMLACAESAGIRPEVLRFVHPRAGSPANLLMFAGTRERSAELRVLPPLVLYAEKGRHHPEVEEIYRRLTGRTPVPRLPGIPFSRSG